VREPVRQLLVASDGFAQADAEVADLGRTFLARCADLLPMPKQEAIAPAGLDVWREAFRIVQAKEVWDSFGSFVIAAKPRLGPGIKERMDFAATVTDEQADRSRAVTAAGRAHIRSLVSPGTIVALPTAPSIAPLVTASGEALEHFRVRTMRLTCTAGIAGLPQISLPVGTVAGCPAGLSFIGWPGGDEILLDLAGELGRFCGIRVT